MDHRTDGASPRSLRKPSKETVRSVQGQNPEGDNPEHASVEHQSDPATGLTCVADGFGKKDMTIHQEAIARSVRFNAVGVPSISGVPGLRGKMANLCTGSDLDIGVRIAEHLAINGRRNATGVAGVACQDREAYVPRGAI